MKAANNIPQEEWDRIENHILGKYTEGEKKAFEQELNTRPGLRAKYREVESWVNALEEVTFKEELNRFHEKAIGPDQTAKIRYILRWKPLAMAASATLILGFFTWYFILLVPTHEKLFNAYYQPDPGLPTTMSNTAAYAFDRGMVDYKTGNYPEAINRWEGLIAEKPKNDTLNYFLGNAYLILGNAEKAKGYLENVVQNDQGPFVQDAAWYLALTYLSTGRVQDAKEVLDKSNHPQKKVLMEKLGSQ
ncbi:MAG: tetratricopeptide repeat protein [Cyclobacteriaceae bacterium]